MRVLRSHASPRPFRTKKEVIFTPPPLFGLWQASSLRLRPFLLLRIIFDLFVRHSFLEVGKGRRN